MFLLSSYGVAGRGTHGLLALGVEMVRETITAPNGEAASNNATAGQRRLQTKSAFRLPSVW